MNPTPMTKKDFELAQSRLMKGVDWLDPSSTSGSRELHKEFKTKAPDGGQEMRGGMRSGQEQGSVELWFQFVDTKGFPRVEAFPAFWIPQDCLQVAQQCYMRLNELKGVDVWKDLKPVRDAHVNKVFEGRLPEKD